MVPTVKPQKWFYLNPPASWPWDGQRLNAVRGGSTAGRCAWDRPHKRIRRKQRGSLQLAKLSSESIVPTGRSGAEIKCSFPLYLRGLEL